MRILQVIATFYPALAFGGPVKVAYNICMELTRRGHDVEVFTTNAYDQTRNFEPISREQIINGFKVTYFNNKLRFSNLFISSEMITTLCKRFREFDVIHTHFGRQTYDIVVSLCSRKYTIPYILQAHGSLPRIGSWRRLKWFYDVLFGYRVLRNASRVIALSHVEADQYRRMGVPEEKIAIVPNGIDLSEYANLPSQGAFKKKFGIPEDKKVILYLGRIHRIKGIDLLIKAYAYLIEKVGIKDAVLVIAGPDDGYLMAARALANSLGIYNSVMFTGFISSEDKLKALVDADVFVTPSFYGFPMTFLESCAVGTPIVTTSLGDTLEWIDRNVGYVTRPTPRDLAEAVYRIISDDELRRKFSRNCIKVVISNFSLEKVIERLEKLYGEVVEK